MKWAAERRSGNSPMPYVFDVYGTLLDVDAAAREAASETGMEVLAANWPELAAAWRARQLSYTWLRTAMQRYTDFWAVTEGALDVTLAEMGLDGNAALRARLLSLYATLSAYDEVPAVLTRMAKDDQACGSVQRFAEDAETALGAAGIASRFDRVLSVDALKRYKPDPRLSDGNTSRLRPCRYHFLHLSSGISAPVPLALPLSGSIAGRVG